MSTTSPLPVCNVMRIHSDATSDLLELQRDDIIAETHERVQIVFGNVKGMVKPRDLRIVDPAFADGETEPAIVVRMVRPPVDEPDADALRKNVVGISDQHGGV